MILVGNRKVLWGLGEKNPRLPDSVIFLAFEMLSIFVMISLNFLGISVLSQ